MCLGIKILTAAILLVVANTTDSVGGVTAPRKAFFNWKSRLEAQVTFIVHLLVPLT